MKTLDPWKERGLKTLDTANPRGLTMAEDLPRRVNGYLVTQPKRWTKADNGRLLPLNSAAWRRLRLSVLAEEPLCQYCPPGSLTPANTIDHANNNPADNTRSNLVSCCVPCHSLKTASDMQGRPARLGCDMNGNPRTPCTTGIKRTAARLVRLVRMFDAEITSNRSQHTDLYPSL